MGTSFMFYLMGFEKFEGWVGIDQFDPNNPLTEGFHQRYRRAIPRGPTNVAQCDPGLGVRHGSACLPRGSSGHLRSRDRGSRTGWSKFDSCRAATGGPRTHIAAAPHEHGMFRGDWLLYGRVRDGKLEFEGLFEPSE